MSYMRTAVVSINEKHPLFSYAERITALANSLSNAVRYRQRQVLTAVSKAETDWSNNEHEVMEEVQNTAVFLQDPSLIPTAENHFLSYYFLEKLMRVNGNPDFFAEGLPRQTAQNVLKLAVKDMKGFYASCRKYHKDPESFTGKPQLPGYKRKGGHASAVISNQDCRIKLRDGKWYAELPFIKDTPVCLGCPIPDARLKQLIISPDNGRYKLCFQFEVSNSLPEMTEASRICAIDFGIDNLMAVANNCGLPCLLYKGGAAKSINQKYNKTIADLVSCQTLITGKKFVPDNEYYHVTNRRNDQISDFMHKCAKHFISWCVENRIDTVVMGVNRYWKQKSDIGKANNQNFVQLPFDKIRRIITYLCEWNGIRCIEQEESYTSKASFPDGDMIPVYGKENGNPVFSGRRKPMYYKGVYKKEGFRGLYQAKDGTIINSDLNGSANILRKAYPNAFCNVMMPRFDAVQIIRYPDLEKIHANRQKQLLNQSGISRAKQKRQCCKLEAAVAM